MLRWAVVVGLAVVLVVVYLWLSPSEMPQAVGDDDPQPVPAHPAAPPSTGEQTPEPAQQAPTAQVPTQPGQEEPLSRVSNVVNNPTGRLKASFEDEPRDALWADAKEEEIRGVLADEQLPDDLIRSASCRRTVCRVEMQWTPKDTSGYRRLSQLVGEHWAPYVGIDYPPNSREEHRLDLFILREGYDFDDLAE